MNNTVTGKQINESKRRDWANLHPSVYSDLRQQGGSERRAAWHSVVFSFIAVYHLKVKQSMLENRGAFGPQSQHEYSSKWPNVLKEQFTF